MLFLSCKYCYFMFINYIPYILNKNVFSISLTNTLTVNSWIVCVNSLSFSIISFFFRYSCFATNSWLIDMGCYEISHIINTKKDLSTLNILWHVWSVQSLKILTLTFSSLQKSNSIELLFRNSKWLEREIGEMHGWFFKNKKDRRSLFLIPVFYTTPLKKSFPVGGFFELILCPLTSKITFRHISWLA